MSRVQPISLSRVRVREAMHAGIIAASAEMPLREVARLMAENHVHAIAVVEPGRSLRPRGIVSGREIAEAAAAGAEPSAGEVAATDLVTISADEPLDQAARMMAELGIGHLLVLEPASGYPAGIISVLDIAAAYAS